MVTIKLTGKQKVMMLLNDGEPHHSLDFLERKMHKFATRISEINAEYPGLIDITPANGHYKTYKLRG